MGRDNDSTGHNSDDDAILSGVEDEDGNTTDQAGNGDGKTGKARKKKTRTVFSRSQVFQLESTFDIKRYLSSSERAGLAASLQLTETQVRISIPFQKEKKHLFFEFFRSRFGFKIEEINGNAN